MLLDCVVYTYTLIDRLSGINIKGNVAVYKDPNLEFVTKLFFFATSWLVKLNFELSCAQRASELYTVNILLLISVGRAK